MGDVERQAKVGVEKLRGESESYAASLFSSLVIICDV